MSDLKDLIKNDLGNIPGDPDKAKNYLAKGDKALFGNNLESALMYFEAAFRLHPTEESKKKVANVNTLIGDNLLTTCNIIDIDEAIDHYQSALNFFPTNETQRKMEDARKEKTFHEHIRKWEPNIIYGIPPKLTKDGIKYEAKKYMETFMFSSHYSDYTTLENKVRKYLEEIIEIRKKKYQEAYSNLEFDTDDIVQGFMEKFYDNTKIEYSILKPLAELIPVDITEHSADDLNSDRSFERKLFNAKSTQLETFDAIRRKRLKPIKGKVYYASNYIVPVEIKQNLHIIKDILIPFGYKNYGLLKDKIEFNIHIKSMLNLSYNGYTGELQDVVVEKIELPSKSWKSYGYIALKPSNQLLKDISYNGLKGGLYMLLPGIGCATCAGIVGASNDTSGVIFGGFLWTGLLVGLISGPFKYTGRDSSEIRELQEKLLK